MMSNLYLIRGIAGFLAIELLCPCIAIKTISAAELNPEGVRLVVYVPKDTVEHLSSTVVRILAYSVSDAEQKVTPLQLQFNYFTPHLIDESGKEIALGWSEVEYELLPGAYEKLFVLQTRDSLSSEIDLNLLVDNGPEFPAFKRMSLEPGVYHFYGEWNIVSRIPDKKISIKDIEKTGNYTPTLFRPLYIYSDTVSFTVIPPRPHNEACYNLFVSGLKYRYAGRIREMANEFLELINNFPSSVYTERALRFVQAASAISLGRLEGRGTKEFAEQHMQYFPDSFEAGVSLFYYTRSLSKSERLRVLDSIAITAPPDTRLSRISRTKAQNLRGR